ncbi:uncharacterized protein N7529_002798 [Penicillium soppii]|uniref:uncharacterized protein n=1 Tax=Penicillium soppii TaxID=69789 RepID=UPI0025469735|nr:uncharacterized protein N7529_002798 [Penicillium soppii]KAJ5874368.1 hypothetical protein N7529_002798 [Penicillium soppii]
MPVSPSIVRMAKTAAATVHPHLQYLVVICGPPHGDRAAVPAVPISPAHQTFTGQTLHAPRQNTSNELHQKLPAKRGNMIALRATSREVVQEQLRNHSYAQGI